MITNTNSTDKGISVLLKEIAAAETNRARHSDAWKANYKAVFGEDWMGDESTFRSMRESTKNYKYDKLLSFIKTEIPGLVRDVPDVFLAISDEAEAQKPGLQSAAKIAQDAVMTILSDLDGLDVDARCMIIDAFCSLMVAKVIPISKVKNHPNAGKVAYIDEATGQEVLYPEKQAGDPEYDICRVDPFKFLVDPDCKQNIRRARWCGEEINTNLASVKNSGVYDAELVTEIEARVKDKAGEDKQDWEIDLTIYEIYNKHENKIKVLCQEYPDKLLRDDDIPEGIEYSPYVVRQLCPIPGQFYGKPEISSGRQEQEDLKKGFKLIKEWADRSNPQVGMKQSFADSLEKEAKKVCDGISRVVKTIGENDVFMINKDMPHANNSIEEYMSMATRNFDENMGQSSMSRGLVGEAKFATEAEISQLKGDQRATDKANMVKAFWSGIIEKLLMLMQYHPTETPEVKQAIELINPDLGVEISIESRSPRNRAIERKQLMEAADRFPGLQNSPTYLKQLLNTFDGIREQSTILGEIEQWNQAQAQAAAPKQTAPEPKGPNVSISFKGELIPKKAANAILDKVFQQDIPMEGASLPPASPPTQPGDTSAAPGTFLPSPASGLEGMEPGNGMMSSGGQM